MSTNQTVKVVGGLAVLAILGFLFIGAKHSSVGGNFNPVTIDAYSYNIGGTEVISHTSGITASSLTATGAVALGSATAGVTGYWQTVTPTADVTATVAQSGSIFNLGTAGVDVTLPAVASSNGVHYRFVISAAYATTNITVVSAEGDNVEGSLIVAGAVVDCDANDVITSVADGENIGDFFDLYSNGTYWYIGASGGLTASKLTCSG